LAWVHGGTRVDHLGWVPWLALACLEWMLLLPPVRRGETLDEARRRVWRGLARDPFLYVALALALFLLLQWAHGGLGMAYDASRGMAVPRLPRIRWLPWCIERGEAVQLLYWFPPACAALLAVRHGVTRRGQRLLLHLLLWNGALLSVFGFIENLSGAKALYWLTPLPSHFFASFGYPNHAGAYFALIAAIGVALWCRATTDGDDRERLRRWRLLAPTALCVAAVWASRSRAAIILSTLMFLAGGVYLLGHYWRQMGMGERVQAVALAVALLASGATFYYVIYPNNPVRAKMATIDWSSPRAVCDAVAQRWYLIPKAMAIWRDHPWYGVGGWGYRSFLGQYIEKGEAAKCIFTGGANVHNDAVQFLAEHGVVGGGLLLALAALLFAPAVGALARSRAGELDEPSVRPAFPFRLPPAPLFLLAGALCTVLHSLVDLPFRCPAVLIGWMLALSCVPSLLQPAAVQSVASPLRMDNQGRNR
jgi:hypothetical protein